MNDNLITEIIILSGVILSEIGGAWLIKLSQRSPDYVHMKKLGKRICILGITGLILGLIWFWFLN